MKSIGNFRRNQPLRGPSNIVLGTSEPSGLLHPHMSYCQDVKDVNGIMVQ